jgi:cell shape-determining protein MreC
MSPSKELLNYGVAVAILFPLIGFLLWAGRSIVKSLLTHIDEFFKGVLEQQKESTVQQKEITVAMKELSRAFAGISERCLACRVDSVSTLRDAEKRIVDKFTEITSSVHDRTFLEIEKGFGALGAGFDKALTGTAESIRKGQAALIAEIERKRLEEEAQRLREENAELSRDHDIGNATPRPIR